jgi:plasmid stabilization system protein ParE
MVRVRFSKKFTVILSKIKDQLLISKIQKQIRKIAENPEVGKPMRNVRKGTRELYIRPLRLSYSYYVIEDMVIILDLYHKKFQ